MRTNDDPNPPPFKPWGEKVTPAKPAPTPAPTPQGKSGIVYENGRARTTTHPKPWEPLTLDEAIANWREHYAAEAQLDFLP